MKIDRQRLAASTANCFAYLINNLLEDGSFRYEVNAQTGTVSNNYNILRHAGSLYAMYQYAGLNSNAVQSSFPILEKGIAYLLQQIKPLKEREGIMCVVENNEAKLGGNGLALLALTEQYKLQPNTERLELMQKLAAFLCYMQKEDGSFKSKILFSENRDMAFYSVYYPGEAILALANLYMIDPNPKWLKAVEMGAGYLLANPVKDNWLPRGHNHWFAMALGELYFLLPKKEYRDELCLIVESTVLSAHNNIFGVPNQTMPSKLFSSAAMATRGEAIMAGILLEARLKNHKQVDEWLPIVQEILTYCTSLQVTLADKMMDDNMLGGVKKSKHNNHIRIDYVQHSMAVMIALLKATNRKTIYR